MGVPEIFISFETAAVTAITRSARGILALVLSDGTMVEIPYEVVDGKIVFTTETMGVFAFVPAE